MSPGNLLGVFGGTFDPIHFGHLRCALEVSALLGAPVHMIPAGLPVHRDRPVVSAEHRLRMLELALSDQQHLLVDDREIRRPGPSFMIDTLESMAAEFAGVTLCLIVGADAFAGLDRWHRWRELFERCHLVVMTRPGPHRELSPELTAFCDGRLGVDPTRLTRESCGQVCQVPVTALGITASEIRRQLLQRQSPRFLLPVGVLNYIRREGLYSDSGL